MKPAIIEGDAKPVGAPPDWSDQTHGRCGALFVREKEVQGLKFMQSAWEASADEIGWLLAGSNVQLGISAPKHPVVNLAIGPTPADGLPVWTVRHITGPQGQLGVRVAMYAPKGVDPNKTGGMVWATAEIGGGGVLGAVGTALKQVCEMAAEKNIV